MKYSIGSADREKSLNNVGGLIAGGGTRGEEQKKNLCVSATKTRNMQRWHLYLRKTAKYYRCARPYYTHPDPWCGTIKLPCLFILTSKLHIEQVLSFAYFLTWLLRTLTVCTSPITHRFSLLWSVREVQASHDIRTPENKECIFLTLECVVAAGYE